MKNLIIQFSNRYCTCSPKSKMHMDYIFYFTLVLKSHFPFRQYSFFLLPRLLDGVQFLSVNKQNNNFEAHGKENSIQNNQLKWQIVLHFGKGGMEREPTIRHN